MKTPTTLRAAWLDTQGHFRIAQARLAGWTGHSFSLELPDPPQAGTRLNVQSDRLGLHGTASVRRVQRQATTWLVEVEYDEPRGPTGEWRWDWGFSAAS